jgi:hypothetical protein
VSPLVLLELLAVVPLLTLVVLIRGFLLSHVGELIHGEWCDDLRDKRRRHGYSGTCIDEHAEISEPGPFEVTYDGPGNQTFEEAGVSKRTPSGRTL